MSIGLTEEELGLLRQESVGWYQFTCDIYKVDGADDVYGGRDRDHDPAPDYADVPCAIEAGAGQENSQAYMGKVEEIQIFTVTLPALTDINLGDHVVVHTTDHPNLHLLVQAELSPEDWEIDRKVIATEIGMATHA